MRKVVTTALALGLLVSSLAWAQTTGLINGANILVRTDSGGSLLAAAQTYTAPTGPLRTLANTLVRTDANGYLIVTNPTGFFTSPLAVTSGGTGTATAFTAGSVVFAGTSGVYAQDNANLFWDDANNRLGIGTSGAPSSALHVVGD